MHGQKLSDIHGSLEKMFDEIIDAARWGLEGLDLGRILVFQEDLTTPIVISIRKLEKISGKTVMDRVEAVLNSHQNLQLNDSLHVDVGTMELPKGGAGNGLPINALCGPNNSIKKKRSIVEIVNEDQTCMARAIGMAYLAVNSVTTDEWHKLRTGDASMERRVLHVGKCPRWYFRELKLKRNAHRQTAFTLELCRRANVPTNRRLTLNDISAFEDPLDLDVLVVSSRAGNKFVRVPQERIADDEQTDEQKTGRQRLYLYLVEAEGVSHYHAIVNICGFFGEAKFCSRCLKPYRNLHRCTSSCFVCKRKEGCVLDRECQMSCRSCHMTCRSKTCFESHRTAPNGKTSACERWWKCCTCKKVLDRKKRNPCDHFCGEWHCRCCDSYVDQRHRCYVRAVESKESRPRFIFFDFECTQEEVVKCTEGYTMQRDVNCNTCKDTVTPCRNCALCIHCGHSWCGKYQHVPNLAVAQKVCEECVDLNFDPKSECRACGNRCSKCNVYDRTEKCFEREPCEGTCGLRETTFIGEKTKQDFGHWLFAEQNKNFTVIAHNLKGYDCYFLLQYLIDNSIKPDDIIYCGSKVMYLHIARGLNIRIVDSLNFLPMGSAKLPNAFGLEEMKKGYFPHFFNTKKNQSYVGLYPPPESYGYDTMYDKDRANFLDWYTEKTRNNEIFDFSKEILEYCRSDVDILRMACLKFRDMLMSITGKREVVFDEETGMPDNRLVGGIDPFNHITIAAVSMNVFKTKFLKENWRVKLRRGEDVSDWLPAQRQDGELKVFFDGGCLNGGQLQQQDYVVEESEFVSSPIAQVPGSGYTSNDTFSQASIRWLRWYTEESRRSGKEIFINHALNEGETKLPGTKYRLDGYCTETNTAYEFQGCFWHGCPVCYHSQRQALKVPRTGQSMEELYTLTLKKKKYIESLGMNYIEIWEHEFDSLLLRNEDAAQFVESLDLHDRLNPRDAFFGGRTNATKLYYKTREDEKVHYLDFCSLYSSVNKYATYPLKEPVILTKDFGDITEYFGIAKVKILPPRRLYHPVLPLKINGKLTFTLCRTCAEKQNQRACTCGDDDRCLLGTWCTPEICKALSCGYTLQKNYEIYHWKETARYDPTTGDGGIFDGYINLFLKIKQEASGWPDWVQSQEDKVEYIRQFQHREGIKLDPQNIKNNLALRSIAKLLLNSLWGKFGQKSNMPHTTFYHESEVDKFFQCLSNPSREIKDFFIVSDDMIQLSWQNNDNTVKGDFNTNIFVATFTSCWARLKLYGVLEMLQERVLYFDTDSVIFVSRPGDREPEVGTFLGELTSELKVDDHIVEFVSGGPKNYAYRTAKGQEVCKVKGFSLNYENSQLINFESLLELVSPPRQERMRDTTKQGDADKVECEGVQESEHDYITVVNTRKISRVKERRILFNRQEDKKYKIVYNKRVILKDSHDTVPYGF